LLISIAILVKGKEVDLYSKYRQYNSTTKRSDVDHTELPANTPHLPSFVYAFARGRHCC